MKFFYVGVAILAALLALCIVSTTLLSRYTAETSALLENAQALGETGDYAGAELQVQAALALWERHHGFYGSILCHSESDQIKTTFCSLLEYARDATAEEFFPTCSDLIDQISHLADMEKPYYYNVL